MSLNMGSWVGCGLVNDGRTSGVIREVAAWVVQRCAEELQGRLNICAPG
jgi:hypothetical protein